MIIYAVPLKGKLTVTRELSSVTRELALSSFESRKIMSLLVD